jgi:hypothetical protein
VVAGQEEGQDKSGLLNVRLGTVNKKGQVKAGSKWVFAQFVLSGGSLHFYVKKEVRQACLRCECRIILCV